MSDRDPGKPPQRTPPQTSPSQPSGPTSGAPQQTVAGLFERPLEKTVVTAARGTEEASARGVDTQLETKPEHVPQATSAEPSVITDLVAFHAEIRRALDKLSSVVGNAKNDVTDAEGARHLVAFFEGPLLWHDEDEEVSLLRRLRSRELDAMRRSVVEATHRGHEKMEAVIDELLAELRAIAKGAGAFDLASFEHNAHTLRALLEGHMTLEETHLFPIAIEELSRPELERAGAEVRSRHGRPSADAVRSRRAVPL